MFGARGLERVAQVSQAVLPWGCAELTPEQATDPDYWVAHLRGTVNFEGGLTKLAGDVVIACATDEQVIAKSTGDAVIAIATGGNVDPAVFARALDTLS